MMFFSISSGFSALHFLLVQELLSLGASSSLHWVQVGGGNPSCLAP